MHEIERKFLVTMPLGEIVDPEGFHRNIEQCYLSDSGDWTIRVRRYSTPTGKFMNAVQTMKRKVSDRKCIELEHAVTEEYFEQVRKQAGEMLHKKRWEVVHDGHTWEVDWFPQFKGLIVAEIELDDEDEDFEHPEWLGAEVTHKKRYRNKRMCQSLDRLAHKNLT